MLRRRKERSAVRGLPVEDAPTKGPLTPPKGAELQPDPIPAEWGRGEACYANCHHMVDELRELAGRYQA